MHTITEQCSKTFANGSVYLLHTANGYPIETTDTYLPTYTKDAIGVKQNALQTTNLGSRKERWMVGVSTMSGCPVRCKFCATGKLDRWKKLTTEEMVAQVEFILSKTDNNPADSYEFKINWTRMGEPFLNIDNVRRAMDIITSRYPNTHHYVSTIGMRGSDFSWIEGNTTLQFSVHSFTESYRDWLIPVSKKMTLEEMGQVRTRSNLKTTLNLTLAREEDFDIDLLKKWFDPKYFFVKLSPINTNDISDANNLTVGVISQRNLV
jgi:23S rRNA (adenine2503-C2)-methyltransferase